MAGGGETLASRRARVQRGLRCVCAWHCACVCVGVAATAAGVACDPLQPDAYRAAGAPGSMAADSDATTPPIFYALWFQFVLFGLAILLVLLLLGLVKGLLGCCCPAAGRWGLGMFVDDTRPLSRYYEGSLAHRKVVYDEEGHPVHPDTFRRSVRTRGRCKELCINLAFFLLFPIVILMALCRRCSGCRQDLRPQAGIYYRWDEGQHPCPGYQAAAGKVAPYQGREQEEEDTRYVLEELQRSRESLRKRQQFPEERQPLLPSQQVQSVYRTDLQWEPAPQSAAAAGGAAEMRFLSADGAVAANAALTDEQRALAYVKRLHDVHVVFRNLNMPVGGVDLTPGFTYSVRGFFVRDSRGSFKFVTNLPLKQFWKLSNGEMAELVPPRLLDADELTVEYADASQVAQENELSELPRGFCINVSSRAPRTGIGRWAVDDAAGDPEDEEGLSESR